jgi:hypothetical protein
MPLHVSSNKCSSSGGPNCINTSFGITHSGSKIDTILLPECVIPDDVLIQFGRPDDEHLFLETSKGMK